ncbi:MAG TPA: hypothetical protein VIY47_14755, partial [Ignavibacteriaceae bacterium]
LVIFDFDGYDNKKIGKNLAQVLNDDKKIMGHGFVLLAMLEYGLDVTPEKIDQSFPKIVQNQQELNI